MARRSAATHAAFLLPHLRAGMRLLDCGCGPGTITVDLARVVRPAETVGFDRAAEQFAESARVARQEGLRLRFETGDVTALPFDDSSFDVVFAHALMEHLADPSLALREFSRVLKPNGIIAVRSPDWGGFILDPYPIETQRAIHAYRQRMIANGGDPLSGRKLPALLRDAGFRDVRPSATYEIYEDPQLIAGYLAAQLDATDPSMAKTLRDWGRVRDALFAQAWVEGLGRR
jgi:ubiquinone/menaquinone biosynthesis C-methylase UbiE